MFQVEHLKVMDSLIQAINDLTQRLSLETQLKDSLDEEVSALREEIDRGQRSREQLLAEVESKHEQEVQTLVTEHAQKVRVAMVLMFPILQPFTGFLSR